MYKFEIYKNSVENSSVTLEVKRSYDIHREVYEHLTSGRYDDYINEETAINIACWCELATVGEDYTTDDITVIVQE